jgi:transposase, IS30 family
MINYRQLNFLQRETIQILLNKGKTFTEIGEAIGKDRTTVSKEIKRNRYIKSCFYESFDIIGINDAISKCTNLQNKPYVCNTCSKKINVINIIFIMNTNLLKKIMSKI